MEHTHSTLYYIVNEAYSNNGTACFWKPNSAGYTSNVKQAGKYTRAECEKVRFASDLLFLPVEQVTPEVCLMVVPDAFWLAHAQKLPEID